MEMIQMWEDTIYAFERTYIPVAASVTKCGMLLRHGDCGRSPESEMIFKE